MLARCEELIPLVDGGDVRSVHDGVFLHQAQPAAVGGGVEVRVGGQRFPRDSEGTVAILVSPDMPSKAGVGALCAVFEEGVVVALPHLEGVGGEAHVAGIWFALLLHPGVIQDVGVQASRRLHGTVFLPASTVAVAVFGQVALKDLVLAEHLVVVGGDDLCHVGHCPVRQLDGVTIEGAPQLVLKREALVHQRQEVAAQLGGHAWSLLLSSHLSPSLEIFTLMVISLILITRD